MNAFWIYERAESEDKAKQSKKKRESKRSEATVAAAAIKSLNVQSIVCFATHKGKCKKLILAKDRAREKAIVPHLKVANKLSAFEY